MERGDCKPLKNNNLLKITENPIFCLAEKNITILVDYDGKCREWSIFKVLDEHLTGVCQNIKGLSVTLIQMNDMLVFPSRSMVVRRSVNLRT
jgi:hypothetical protein